MQSLLFAPLAAGVAIPAFGVSLRYRREAERYPRTPGRSGSPRHLDALGGGRSKSTRRRVVI